jgi:hypothetical protein
MARRIGGSRGTLRFMDAPSLEEFRRALNEAGWREVWAHPGFGFGSWTIELEWALRVTDNGKDGLLLLERETSRDNWVKVWVARERREQTPAALLDALP